MLNWATLEASSDRLVFTDGDCVPHRHFSSAYARVLDPETVYCGRRVDVMEEAAQSLSLEDVRAGRLESWSWFLRNVLAGRIDYGEQAVYLPAWLWGGVAPIADGRGVTLLGSNFSIHRKWLKAVNGFDESFQSPGIGEDTDLERRLRLAGAVFKWSTHRAIQYHLWHPLTQVGEQSRRTFAAHAEKGNQKALRGLKELEGLLKL
jgi:GT2 family glycosyltransferase